MFIKVSRGGIFSALIKFNEESWEKCKNRATECVVEEEQTEKLGEIFMSFYWQNGFCIISHITSKENGKV